MTTPPKCPSRLSERWVFWQDRWQVTDAGDRVQKLIDLGEADSARQFWHIFDSNPVEQLPESCSLHVFKGHVRPEWEDPANIDGGHFRFIPIPDQPANPSRAWYNLILSAIGGQFTLASSVNGVGFTNKGSRKFVTVWVNTTDSAKVRTLQAEMHTYVGDKFTTKFIAHKTLPRSDFLAQEAVWHRRTKSAPSQYVTALDDDDTDSLAAGSTGPHEGLRRRHAPMPLDTALAQTSESPVRSLDGVALGAPGNDHLRSKSEGVSRDIVPVHPSIASTSRPPRSPPPGSHHSSPHNTNHAQNGAAAATQPSGGHSAAPGGPLEKSETGEFNWQDSHMSELRDSNSGVYPAVKAPTPMKVWADQWSPSMLNVGRLDGGSQTTSPGTGMADAQSQMQQQRLAAANAQLQAHGMPPNQESPMSLSRTQPQGTLDAALGGATPESSRPPPAAQQPFGSFPPRHDSPGQQGRAFPVQQQGSPYGSEGSQQGGRTGSPGQGGHVIHNPYQLQHATQPYSVPPQHQHQHQHQHQFAAPQTLPASAYPSQPLPYVIVRQPVAHTSPQHPTGVANDGRPRAADRAPVRQGVSQPGRSPPPSGRSRESPPPKSNSPAPGERRSQHTKSDAPPFLFKGWMFPSGLNRKERRRIMFSDEVTPDQYPGAVFVNADLPDGPCTEDGQPLPKEDGEK